MGKSNGTLKPLRIGLKSVEFLCSLFLIAALYKIGPHWILLLASLAVPIYGIYLIVVKIHPHQSEFAPSMPYLQYKSQLKAKSWLKADMAISLSMCVVTFGFGIVLFFGYFAVSSTFLLLWFLDNDDNTFTILGQQRYSLLFGERYFQLPTLFSLLV